ncbi:Cellulose-binding protein [Diplocarpon rosae]|nr:Cellulose-binding protein [Diplocarpon rosae]
MKYAQVLAGAAALAVTQAHTTIYNILVNDVDQGLGNSAAGYIRSPPNNNPVKDVTSKDMTCNVNNVPTAKTIDVAAGDKITLQWHHDNNLPTDDIIASSHKGPVMAYLAPTASEGAGDVWVKVAEDGYANGKWGVENLIAAKGKFDVTLPAQLAPGEYLLRGEIIALHEGDASYATNPGRGAQFYMECVQLKVAGTGTTTLPAGIAIPGAYSPTDPGIVFNIYGSVTSYPVPGGPVWDGAAGGATYPGTPTNNTEPAVSSPPVPPPAEKPYVPDVSTSTANAAAPPAGTPYVPDVPTSTPIAAAPPPGTPYVADKPTSTPNAAAPPAGTPYVADKPTTTANAAALPPPPTNTPYAGTPATTPKPDASVPTYRVDTPPKPNAAVPTTLSTSTRGPKTACRLKNSAGVAAPSGAVPSGSSGYATQPASGGTVAKYGQCGGINYQGSTTCADGSTCTQFNEYYSQCV